MSHGFDFYEGPTTDSTSWPRITVRRGGLMVLTWAAVEMLGDGISHIQVGFNPETRAIGLRAAGRGTKGSYRLREQRNSFSRLVDGKGACGDHGLTARNARQEQRESMPSAGNPTCHAIAGIAGRASGQDGKPEPPFHFW